MVPSAILSPSARTMWISRSGSPKEHNLIPAAWSLRPDMVKGGPEYSVQIRDWKSGDAVMLGDFGFKNPTNAEKIDVNDLKHNLGELPENFVVGDEK